MNIILLKLFFVSKIKEKVKEKDFEIDFDDNDDNSHTSSTSTTTTKTTKSTKSTTKRKVSETSRFFIIICESLKKILNFFSILFKSPSKVVSKKKKIDSSASVFELMQPLIGELPHEEFWIVYLNNSNKVIQTSQLSKGGITGTLVDIRLALKIALQVGATSIILSHNHPSGILQPSEADKQLTKKLKIASESLDIKVLDHLIITEKTYFSFADQGLL